MTVLRTRCLAGQLIALVVLFAILGGAAAANARDHYVAPNGDPGGNGRIDSPWDLASALNAEGRVRPGDTIWIRGGTYRAPFVNVGLGFLVNLVGESDEPITVRGYPGERATIDGGLDVEPPSTHLVIRDLEIVVSEPRPTVAVPPVPNYINIGRPMGGLTVTTGDDCKYIDLVIHDNSEGIGFWKYAADSELNGCLIYDNGWSGTDRGHGHAIYTQNAAGLKTISDCIMTGGYEYSMHAFGSYTAPVNNYLVERNIFYRCGPFLIGGYSPSSNITVRNNYFYGDPSLLFGIGMQLGYGGILNADLDLENNLILNGTLYIQNWQSITDVGNQIIPPWIARPPGEKIIFHPSLYDPARANLAIFDFDHAPAVSVDLTGFVNPGERYLLMDPRGFYEQPVLTGIYSGAPISVPVDGEFAAFVVLREPVSDVPSHLSADVASRSQIDLAWINNATQQTGVVIERSRDEVNYSPLATVGADLSHYSDTGLSPSTAYYYRVRSQSGSTLSEPSNVASGITIADAPLTPAEPVGATPMINGQIRVHWIGPAAPDDVVYVEHSLNGINWVQAGAADARGGTFVDQYLDYTTTYYYRLRNGNSGGYTGYRGTVSATTLISPPPAPTNLTASLLHKHEIQLAWTSTATNVDGFYLERSDDGIQFTRIASVDAGVRTTIDRVDKKQIYSYRVRAWNAGGYSGASNVVTIDASDND